MAGTANTDKRPVLDYTRAIVTWVIAYVVINVLATGLFFVIAAVQHTGSPTHPLQDPSYVLEEELLPICNLLVWTALALVYFGSGMHLDAHTRYREALRLGVFWVAIALPVNLLFFVVRPGPLSMSAHDFYVGQFPWIYLTYLAAFVSPTCAVVVQRWQGHLRDLRNTGTPRRIARVHRGHDGVPGHGRCRGRP